MASKRNYLVWLAAALVLGASLALASCGGGTGAAGALPSSGDIDDAQLRQLVAQGARLIDVRTPEEFGSGTIGNAENVPIDTLQAASASWDKSKPVIVFCATGARSANALGYLRAQGFQHVYDLTVGMAGWDGQPVTAGGGGQGGAPATGKPTLYSFSSST